MLRVTAVAGFGSAVLLLVNVARRGGLLPETALTHAIAPLAPLAGLLAITGVYLVIRHQAGRLGLIGYLLNAAGLAGAFAIEYSLHYVFPYLSPGVIAALLAGGTGRAFLVTAVVLISGVVLFAVAALRTGALPAAGLVLYLVGMVPGALRSAVPLPVYLAGLFLAAAGILWLSVRLWSATEEGVALSRHGAITP